MFTITIYLYVSSDIHSLNSFSNVAADVALEQAQYSVQENESSLMVCAKISGVPSGGLECDVVVTFVLVSNSTKAGMLYLHCRKYSRI